VRFALLVRDEDATEALRVLGPQLVGEEHEAEAHALETRFEAGRGHYVECPACGARQEGGAAECPECGLALGGEPPAED
jgi:rubrerythrin